jgi:hypothetical protein
MQADTPVAEGIDIEQQLRLRGGAAQRGFYGVAA